jgi:hypothetical protein
MSQSHKYIILKKENNILKFNKFFFSCSASFSSNTLLLALKSYTYLTFCCGFLILFCTILLFESVVVDNLCVFWQILHKTNSGNSCAWFFSYSQLIRKLLTERSALSIVNPVINFSIKIVWRVRFSSRKKKFIVSIQQQCIIFIDFESTRTIYRD